MFNDLDRGPCPEVVVADTEFSKQVVLETAEDGNQH